MQYFMASSILHRTALSQIYGFHVDQTPGLLVIVLRCRVGDVPRRPEVFSVQISDTRWPLFPTPNQIRIC